MCVLGSFLHRSALFMIPIYFISQKKITVRYLLCVIFALPMVFLLKSPIVSLLNVTTLYTQYGEYSGDKNAWLFFLMMILIFVIILWKINELHDIRKDAPFFIASNLSLSRVWLCR